MARYVLGRLLGGVGVLFVIMTASFFLMRLAPGGPFDSDKKLHPVVERNLWITHGMAEEIRAGEAGQVEAVLVARRAAVEAGAPLLRLRSGGLVRAPRAGEVLAITVEPGATLEPETPVGAMLTPLWRQYFTALSHYARFDFGATLSSQGQRTVWETIARSFPISMELGLWAMALALLLGVPAGLVAGLRANTWVDYATMSASMVGVSLSAIVLGPLLIALFGVHLGWIDYGGWRSGPVKVLPVLTLGLIYAAYFARLTRGGMLEIIGQDFIRTARAKGLTERQVVLRHALRGAILPSVSFLGPGLAGILVGSIVVERIFNIPGISEYFVTGALNRDYPLVMGVVLLYSALLVALNLAVDVAYGLLDPRVRHGA